MFQLSKRHLPSSFQPQPPAPSPFIEFFLYLEFHLKGEGESEGAWTLGGAFSLLERFYCLIDNHKRLSTRAVQMAKHYIPSSFQPHPPTPSPFFKFFFFFEFHLKGEGESECA